MFPNVEAEMAMPMLLRHALPVGVTGIVLAGLLIPTLGAYFWKKRHPAAALVSMIGGGSLTIIVILPRIDMPFGLDASVFGILLSALLFFTLSLLFTKVSVHAGSD